MKDAKSRERGTLEDVVPRNLQLLVIDDKEIDPLKIYTNIDPIYIPDSTGSDMVPWISLVAGPCTAGTRSNSRVRPSQH